MKKTVTIETLTRIREAAKTGKVEFAEQDAVNELEDDIAVVLNLLGHSDAFVSDESSIGDFDEWGSKPWATDTGGVIVEHPGDPEIEKRNAARLVELGKRLGFSVERRDTIVSVAQRIRKNAS